MMIQTSYLTPPMAPAIFYLRAVAPPEITIKHMYRGVIPFIALQILAILIVIIFPSLVTYLPSVMLNFR
jgi:TRAP-type mannitol/chloroaromatic compound transport system permease large subunit